MIRVIQRPDFADAIQFTGDVGLPEIVELDLECRRDDDGVDVLIVQLPEGEVGCRPGDWIVRWLNDQDPKVDVFTDVNFRGNFYKIVEDPAS